jgi:Glycosyltransferase family 87
VSFSLTPRRIKIYPRIVLIVLGTVMVVNLAGSTGWRGLGGQVLFHDFVIFYGAGTLFHRAPASLYDFNEQLSLQRSLIAPTPLEGTGPFSHPPYVASLLEMLTGLTLVNALIVWTALSCAALGGAVVLAHRLVGRHPWSIAVPMQTFALVALSLAPVLFGLYSGQMHSFVLLGSFAVIVLVLDDKPWQAGAVAGLLAIKPQVALSFLIFFVARRNFKACIAAALTFGGLNALFVSRVGFETAVQLYTSYVDTTRALLTLPFTDGFPSYLLLTPYGLMSGLVGPESQRTILVLSNILAVVAILWFLADAWRWRSSEEATRVLLGRTLLLPSLVTPYLMMYDAAPLVVACVLIVPPTMPRRVLDLGATVYGALWIYPPVSAVIGVPLGALVPVGLWIAAAKTGSPIGLWRRITRGGGNEPSSPGCADSACGFHAVSSLGVGASPAGAGEGRCRVDGSAND